MRKSLLCAALITFIWGSSACYGAGFKVSEQGAKAMSMANAFAAQADDPSALYYNPAGIAFLPGAQVHVGATGIIVPQTEFRGTTPLSGNPPLDTGNSTVKEHSKRALFGAPTIYATYSPDTVPVSVGLGINSIYSLSKSWDDSSVFRNQVQNVSIQTINFQPTLAYRLDNIHLALAAAADVTYAVVSLQRSVYSPFIDPTAPSSPAGAYEVGSLGLDGTATGLGYNVGLSWRPFNFLSFGATYRSKMTLDIDGDANFLATTPTGMGAIGLSDTAVFPYSRARATSTASTKVTLPDSFDLAVACRPIDQLTAEFDATWTGWSTFKKLEIEFDSPQFAAFNNQGEPRNWKNSWSFKWGLQYALTGNVDLRGGYSYDLSPVPDQTVDPLLPDSDRHSFSIGTGIHNSYANLDLAYMWVHFLDREVHNQDMTTLRGANGTFKSDAYLLAANLSVKF